MTDDWVSKCLPPLIGRLGIYQNIPASDTKLTPSLGICYIRPLLVMDKLIPVYTRVITSPPKISLLLEVKHTSAASLNQGLSLLRTRITFVRRKRSTRRDKCTFNISIGLSALQMLCDSSSHIASQNAVKLTQCFRSTFLLTQKLGTACDIEMAVESDK